MNSNNNLRLSRIGLWREVNAAYAAANRALQAQNSARDYEHKLQLEAARVEAVSIADKGFKLYESLYGSFYGFKS